jgi:toxin ParE1/3/4
VQVSHKVAFSPEALADLTDLYDYIAAHSGPDRAIDYIDHLEKICRNLATFPERGTQRDDLRLGLRILGIERRALIAFRVTQDTVTILRLLYGGRDLGAALADSTEA